MSESTSFGLWVKQHRKELGITHDELADAIGCSAITLLKIEAGKRRPSRQIALLLAEYFDVPADEREAFVTFARTSNAEFGVVGYGSGNAEGEVQFLPQSAIRNPHSTAPWRAAHLRQTNLPAVLTPL